MLRNFQPVFYMNLFSFCIQILSSSKMNCKTSVNPIEFLKPHVFNPSILQVESIDFRTKNADFCILSISIDYQSDIVRITLTIGHIDEYEKKQVSLKKYIGLESETFIKDFNYICVVQNCNIDYLRMILITGELDWLLRSEDYSEVMPQLRSLLYREKGIRNANLRCFDHGKKPVLCENGACEVRDINTAAEYERFCRIQLNAHTERHYIDVEIWTDSHLHEQTKRFLKYLCNVDLCSDWEVVDKVLTLLEIEDDTSNLFWPSEDRIKFTTTTRSTTSTSITKRITLSTEKFTNFIYGNTDITKQSNSSLFDTNTLQTELNITTIASILSSSNDRSERESSVTNTDLNFISTISTSTTTMIFNNTSHLEIDMFIYYLIILYFIIII